MTSWMHWRVQGASEFPENLHVSDLRNSILATIDALRLDASRIYEGLGGERTSISDTSVTLALMGERGSGKSTLLNSVTTRLEQGPDLVLGVMRPELFTDSDSVVSSFLSSLWAHFAREDEAVALEDERGILPLITATARSYAAWTTPQAALEHSSEGPIDFAEDVILAARSGVRLARRISELAHMLCTDPADGGTRLVIIPIDDADLAPRSIHRILADLRVLGTVPGLVPITCWAPADLTAAWTAEATDRNTDADRVNFVYRRTMEKVFPFQGRFEIRSLDPEERAAFTPLQTAETLIEKLDRFGRRLRAISGIAWDPVRAFIAPEIAGIESPLPSNPRSLVQLCSALDAVPVGEHEEVRHEFEQGLLRVIELMSEPLEAALGLGPGKRVYRVGGAHPENGRRRLYMAGVSLQMSVSRIGPFSHEGAPSRLRGIGQEAIPVSLAGIDVRPLGEVTAAMRSASTTGNGPDERPYVQLEPDARAALLAFQEIAHASGAFAPAGEWVFVGWSDWAWLQQVMIGAHATDNRFIVLPDATTISEARTAARLWNEFVDQAEGVSAREVLAMAVCYSCRTVDESAPVMRSYEDALDLALQTYRDQSRRREHSAQAFAEWFERFLLWHWHEAFFSVDELRSFCSLHAEAIAETEKQEENKRSTAAAGLNRRISPILEAVVNQQTANTHAWVAGFYVVASYLSSTHAAGLAELHRTWRDQITVVRAGAAAASGLFVEAPGVRGTFAPYSTPEGEDLLARAEKALALRLASARARLAASGP